MKWLKKYSLLITILLSGLVLFGAVMAFLIVRNHDLIIEADYLAKPVVRPAPKQKTKYEIGPPDPQEMLELVNLERKKVGVAPLVINESVQTSAQLKADDMAEKDYFSHYLPGTDRVVTPEMGRLLSQECISSSENIVDNIYENTSQSAVAAWIRSKPHYEAMIDSKYVATGFGIAKTKIVQHFCVTK